MGGGEGRGQDLRGEEVREGRIEEGEEVRVVERR